MMRVLTEAPVWVWPLLALLVVMGLRAARERTVPVPVILGMSLLGLLAIRPLMILAPGPALLAVFALSYAGGTALGHWRENGLILWREGAQVRLRGDIWVLVAMLVIFTINFALGVVSSVAPDLVAQAGFQFSFLMLEGLVAGSFLGRALAVLRATDRAAAS